MSADTTHIRYKCPFCDHTGTSPKSVKGHVSSTKTGKHRGKNGYTMSETIQTTEDPSELPMIERIERAHEQFDKPLDGDDAEKVTEHAKSMDDELADVVSKYMVLRVWQDAGYEVKVPSRSSIYYDDLTARQKPILQYLYHTDLNGSEIASELENDSKSNVYAVNRKYEFMMEDQFISDQLIENDPTSDSSETNNSDTEPDDDDIQVSPSMSADVLSELKKAQTLADAGVDISLDITVLDNEFDAISSLIEADEKALAKEIFDDV